MHKKIKIILIAVILGISLLSIVVVLLFAFDFREESSNISKAQQLFTQKNYPQAKKILLQLVRENIAADLAYPMLAEIFESEFNFEAAAYCYSQATALSPLNKELQHKQAAVLSLLEDYQSVVDILNFDFQAKLLDIDALTYYAEADIFLFGGSTIPDAIEQIKNKSAAHSQYIDAITAIKNKNFSTAIKLFKNNDITKLPAILQIKNQVFLSQCYRQQDQQAEAEKVLIDAAPKFPAIITRLLADFYISNDRLSEAISCLEKYNKEDETSPNITLQLAELYCANNEIDKLNKIITSYHPGNKFDIENINYMKALVAFAQGNINEIKPLLTVAQSLSDRTLFKIMNLYSAVAAKDIDAINNIVNDILNSVNAYDVNSRIETALQPLLLEYYNSKNNDMLQKVAAIIVKASGPKSAVRDMALNVLLINASNAKIYPQMYIYASELLKHDPNNLLAILSMAEALRLEGRAQESLLFYNKLPSEDLSGMLGKAMAYYQLQDYTQSEKYFDQAWSKTPGDMVIFENFSALLFELKKYAKIQSLYSALPDNNEANYIIHYLNAKIAEIHNDQPLAGKEYMLAVKYLKELPKTNENRYRLGYLLAINNFDSEAAAVYRELLKEMPNDLMLLINLSEVEIALGNKNAAMLLAEKALRLYPDAQEAQDCLARRQKDAS